MITLGYQSLKVPQQKSASLLLYNVCSNNIMLSLSGKIVGTNLSMKVERTSGVRSLSWGWYSINRQAALSLVLDILNNGTICLS